MRVFVQRWAESELGWGQRPDGVSIHFTDASRKLYIGAYKAAMEIKNGGKIPDLYEFPDGEPKEMVFDHEHASEDILAKVLKEHDFRDYANYPKYLKEIE